LRNLSRREFARGAASFGLAIGLPGNLKLLSKERKSAAVAPAKSNIANINGAESLRAHAEAVGLYFGFAVVPELLDLDGVRANGSSDLYTQTVVSQANILVAENAMKWSSLRPTPTSYDFSRADKLFDFAAFCGQLVRGHNLCWHEQLPAWFAATATRENARALLTQHIQIVAGRYAGKVQSWDVVNEAINIPDGRADGLRKSPWLDLIGPEYLEEAFNAAAQADPQARLTYNDYDIELDTAEQTAKRGQVLMLVRRLHARGIPVHAVGIQSHLQANGPQPGAGIVGFIRELATLGIEVYITEMDVNTHTLAGGNDVQDAAVAAVYKNYLGLLLPEPNVKAVLTWGITDSHTWLNQSTQPWAERPDGSRQRPLPLDEGYRPTAAFYSIRAALDAARQPVATSDITKSPSPSKGDPFAPFAVPGSPAGEPGPKP